MSIILYYMIYIVYINRPIHLLSDQKVLRDLALMREEPELVKCFLRFYRSMFYGTMVL